MSEETLQYFITEDLFVFDETETKQKIAPAETKPQTEQSTVEEPPAPIQKVPQEAKVDLMVMVFPMNSQDEELLNKLLQAIKKDRNEVHLVTSFSDFHSNFNQLLSFGYLDELRVKLDSNIAALKYLKTDGKELLVAPSLSTLHNNRDQKKQLWDCLQEMFL